MGPVTGAAEGLRQVNRLLSWLHSLPFQVPAVVLDARVKREAGDVDAINHSGAAPAVRAYSRSPTGRAAVFSGWHARRGALSIAQLSTSAATPQTARKGHCPKGWSEIGRLGAPTACMGTSPCGASGPPTHPDCAPTRPVRDREQALCQTTPDDATVHELAWEGPGKDEGEPEDRPDPRVSSKSPTGRARH